MHNPQETMRRRIDDQPKKCQFAMASCSYLGHIVGNGEVKPEQTKLAAARAFPILTTKKQVRAFVGLTGYYRKICSDYAAVVIPLTDLTRKQVPDCVVWTPEGDAAFTTLKDCLCSSCILRSPDFSRPFLLQTDASDRGVGAVLSQLDDEGTDHPIAYYSWKLEK